MMSAPWSVRERAFSRKFSLKDSICSRKVGKKGAEKTGEEVREREKIQTGEGGEREEVMLWGVEMRRAEG